MELLLKWKDETYKDAHVVSKAVAMDAIIDKTFVLVKLVKMNDGENIRVYFFCLYHPQGRTGWTKLKCLEYDRGPQYTLYS